MNTKHSINFWLIFALWVLSTLFMCTIELIGACERLRKDEVNYMHYGLVFGGIVGILTVLFVGLYLIKNNNRIRFISKIFLFSYILAQIILIGFCIEQDISHLMSAVVNRILFILFHLVICYFALKNSIEDEVLE